MFGIIPLPSLRHLMLIALFGVVASASFAATYSPTNMAELRNAIQQANINFGLDTINLANSGLYSFSPTAIADSAKGDTNSMDGDLDITDSLTINGNNSTIDAGNRDRLFYIQGSQASMITVTINSLSMRNGQCDPTVSPNHGGAIYGYLTNLTINSSTISACTTNENGGAIAIFGYYNPSSVPPSIRSTLSLNGTSISNNFAANGGGIMSCLANVATSNCKIFGNEAQSPVSGALGGGAALFTGSPTSISITNHTSIANNLSLVNTGGVGFLKTDFVNINQSLISGNTAALSGGGVYCQEALLSLSNSILTGNSAAGYGGGFYGSLQSHPSTRNCTVSHNSASTGGGYYLAGLSSPVIRNTIIESNSGGALVEGDASSDPTVQYCLFNGNLGFDYLDEGLSALTGPIAINDLAQADGNIGGNSLPLMDGPSAITGNWTAAPVYNSDIKQTTLIDASSAYASNALVGQMIICNESFDRNQAYITANTATSIVVSGDVRSYVSAGDIYKIVDYHLQSGSAAMDAGNALNAPVVDYDNASRPYDFPGIGLDGLGKGYDIGAFEARATHTPTPTSTRTYTPSPTPTQTATPSPTQTQTITPSPTVTSTRTNTPTPVATKTNTPSPTQTQTITPSPTATSTRTNTPTPIPTKTNTPSPTQTRTSTPSPTATSTRTNTPTPIPTKTSTSSPTVTSTRTSLPGITPTPTPKQSITPTATPKNTLAKDWAIYY